MTNTKVRLTPDPTSKVRLKTDIRTNERARLLGTLRRRPRSRGCADHGAEVVTVTLDVGQDQRLEEIQATRWRAARCARMSSTCATSSRATVSCPRFMAALRTRTRSSPRDACARRRTARRAGSY